MSLKQFKKNHQARDADVERNWNLCFPSAILAKFIIFFKLELILSNTKELYQMLMLCMP